MPEASQPRQAYRGYDPNGVITHTDAHKWPPVVIATVQSATTWCTRCPACGKQNFYGSDFFRHGSKASCNCEQPGNWYIVAPPGTELAPYPDFCLQCRDIDGALTFYAPIHLNLLSNDKVIAYYTCIHEHQWQCNWRESQSNHATLRPTGVRCALYRHFDASGILLYVGISEEPLKRGKRHAEESIWVQFAVRMEAEWLDDRATAEVAEREAIRSEQPIFNKVHSSREAQRRIASYLDSKGHHANR